MPVTRAPVLAREAENLDARFAFAAAGLSATALGGLAAGLAGLGMDAGARFAAVAGPLPALAFLAVGVVLAVRAARSLSLPSD